MVASVQRLFLAIIIIVIIIIINKCCIRRTLNSEKIGVVVSVCLGIGQQVRLGERNNAMMLII